MEGRDGPIGVSAGWQRVLELVELAAPVDTSVLLLGESGTGKEEVAKLLHARSPRAASRTKRSPGSVTPLSLAPKPRRYSTPMPRALPHPVTGPARR